MEKDKKDYKKIDFFEASKEQQEEILREALERGQEEQRALEDKYEKQLNQGVTC